MPKSAHHPSRAPFALAAYMLAGGATVFWPSPMDSHHGLAWFLTARFLHWTGTTPGWAWLDYYAVEGLSNVVMFVPLGFFCMTFAGARRWWMPIVIIAAVSCAIELVQLTALSGRYASVQDFLANTVGGVLGSAAVDIRRSRGVARGLLPRRYRGAH